jgi:NAD(P)-dependent dehydrogenase (short-subunit alcohol dehydrogenase family)
MELSKSFNLSGRSALITGAAGFLGRLHAESILVSGGQVILTDICEEQLNETAQRLSQDWDHTKIYVYRMDVTDKLSVDQVLQDFIVSGNNIDILINNAAIDPKVDADNDSLSDSRLENFSLDNWNNQIAVGLTGAFVCSQIVGSHMANNRRGVILNIASDLSVIAPDQRIYMQDGLSDLSQPVKPVSYSVIKHGMLGLTKYLATYWAEKGVRSNALSPGGIFHNQPSEFVARVVNRIPLGRMAELQDYQGAVQFLVSDASSYMTGQNIIIDGGRSVW